MKRIGWFMVCGLLLAGGVWGAARSQTSAPAPVIAPPSFPMPPVAPDEQAYAGRELARPQFEGATGPNYGVDFISSAENPADDLQYANALATGASWNRWPVYWQAIETSADQFDWSAHDPVVSADMAHGLQLELILMGVPGFYFSGSHAVPNTLWEPIFDDGSDNPAPGKGLNPNNKWARFVGAAVQRYRPGGVLAQAQGWPDGVGVRHWEMWNEPDLPWFWDGSKAEYARLLKVGYLAVKSVDPQAQVISGAMANNFDGAYYTYYDDILSLYDADPMAASQNYFHDIMATHSYYYAWQTWLHVFRAGNAMAAHGLHKPIWLNETGVPAWNDYPGPVWDPLSAYRATQTEQADYMVQTAFYAIFAGADAIFHFQLYDGCGNQPRGTDFPPHNGELCTPEGMLIGDPTKPCAGDANGLYRNPTDAACFTQHPQPETPRQNLSAYRVLTTYVTGVEPLWRLRPGDTQEWIALYRPAQRQRVLALWARYGTNETATVEALGAQATWVGPDGVTQTLTPVDGRYVLSLPAATNQNADFAGPTLYPIGGRPSILIEVDEQAPVLPGVTLTDVGNQIEVAWPADDGLGSGVATYDVAVAVDGGAFEPWLSGATVTSGSYPATLGHVYRFRAQATDRAGNVSPAAVSAEFSLEPLPLSGAKMAGAYLVEPGETLTYVIRLVSVNAPYPAANLSDPLPAGAVYNPGSLNASAGQAAYADGVVTWMGNISPGATITLTYGVTIDPALGETRAVLVNEATVVDGFGRTFTLAAQSWVNPWQVALPLIRK